jgi:ATP-dependent Clp protease adapter protein ClpS
MEKKVGQQRHRSNAVTFATARSFQFVERKVAWRCKPAPKYRLCIITNKFNPRQRGVEILSKTLHDLSLSQEHESMKNAHTNGRKHFVTTVHELAEHYIALPSAGKASSASLNPPTTH